MRDEDRALQCESECMLWFHAECANVSDEEYDLLSGSNSIWECSACKSSGLPALNSIDAVDVFHFDFQKKSTYPQANCWQTVLSAVALDLPIWNLFSIIRNNNCFYVA